MSAVAVVLLLSIIAGVWRLQRGPSGAERILGAQMMSTTTIALLLVTAEWQQQDALRDVALVLALLAAVVIAALVQRLRGTGDE
ncbi:monovalent cation/H+ antiporter complex subunit F [Gilvimarinus sp. F26214L]|uniref:monovalent cation/H+ antiporter complex subunit F n=1 Tax=Gilvimarinus sp. DZF01 TaxID=3461371 RepID=UPI004046327C